MTRSRWIERTRARFMLARKINMISIVAKGQISQTQKQVMIWISMRV